MKDLETRLRRARGFYDKEENIKALEILVDLSLVEGYKEKADAINHLQGAILKNLEVKAKNPDVKFTYLLGAAECFSDFDVSSSFAATSLFHLAEQIGSVLYYKESLCKANKAFFAINSGLVGRELKDGEKKALEYVVNNAVSRIAESKTCVLSPVNRTVGESKENEETNKPYSDFTEPFTSYWAGLNLESRRNFLTVSVEKLTNFVQSLYGSEGRDALEQVLSCAKKYKKWRLWMCRSCCENFSTSKECKNHFEQEHVVECKEAIPQRISKDWARKISRKGWKPVDAEVAVEMINNQVKDEKPFTYENGWSEEWPSAVSFYEERSKLLQEIRSLLVSFWDCKILSCSIRDRVMQFVVTHFESLKVSKQDLTYCRLIETPQSICFLECRELNRILNFLKKIKCVRRDGTDVISRAVESFCSATRVKEKIEFDSQFSFMLLDKRLLQSKIVKFDDEGTINVIDPYSDYYGTAHARWDVILCWLADYSLGDESFLFPRPIRAHNLDIWVAVLRAVQFMCRNLKTKYAKKPQVLDYDAALTEAKNLCVSENERRGNLQEAKGNRYAALLCDGCEERCTENLLYKGLFLNVVHDVLNDASYPTYYYPRTTEDLRMVISESKHPSDDMVLKSIDHLKLMVTSKISLIDSKILLIENSRMNLLNDLTKISVFDYRSYILRPLKVFLLDGVIDEKSKAMLAGILLKQEKKSQPEMKKNNCSKEELDGIVDVDASARSAQAVSQKKQEKEKKSGSKLKKHRSNKRASTSMSSFNDELSVNRKPGSTSPSLKTADEDSTELEDSLSGERDQLEIPSSIDNQEEATKDNMPGEDSLSKQLESANGAAVTRCNLALDMTLKALCNIKVLREDLVHNRQQFPENLENGVSLALRNFFVAFCSEDINEEEVYSHLLHNLLASLEEVCSMSNDAAQLLVAILEFWPCWKSPERESLVTCLFLLEVYEGMTCSNCGREPNYPEQWSYGLVLAADSIRERKCAFGDTKFQDILKEICLDYKMLCDTKTGGCGEENFVRHTMCRRPPIFTIVLQWEKDDTEKEISDTTTALDREIDMSRLYRGVEPNTMYRLVSMIGCGEEEEYICLAYEKTVWVSFRGESLAKKAVGNWSRLVKFCGEEKVRPIILFYEAVQWPYV